MKKIFVLLCLFQLTITFAQINYISGYVVTKDGQKTNCFIKDKDWAFNPDSFMYRLTENGQTIEALPTDVEAFGAADGSFKFISRTIDIDVSNGRLDDLSDQRSPEFETKTLFLKTMIEGDANLYSYRTERYQRYFYSTSVLKLQQLVYKQYALNGVKIRENNQFKQQLKSNLRCASIVVDEYLILEYEEQALAQLFVKYNNCVGVGNTLYITVEEAKKEKSVAWKLKLGLNKSGVDIHTASDVYNTYIDKEYFFAVGTEFEYIFPFNKNKVSIFIDPFYQSYSGTNSKEYTYGQLDYLVEYSSIEIPVGFRYYLYLQDDLAVFANLSWYIFDIHLSGDAYIDSDNYAKDFQDDLASGQSYALGLGVNYKRFSLETRFVSKRNLLKTHSTFALEYQKVSYILGYRFL